jgi:hypothetical protein
VDSSVDVIPVRGIFRPGIIVDVATGEASRTLATGCMLTDGTLAIAGRGARAAPMPFRDLIMAWREATNGRAPIVWVSREFLDRQRVRPFEDIPNWIPDDDPEPGFYRVSNTRARAHGLVFRSVAETIRNEIAGLGDAATLRTPGGMSRSWERELIAAWHGR